MVGGNIHFIHPQGRHQTVVMLYIFLFRFFLWQKSLVDRQSTRDPWPGHNGVEVDDGGGGGGEAEEGREEALHGVGRPRG